MAQTYEVIIHGSGFHVQTDEGAVLSGFYATRRVRADDPFEANAHAIAMVQKELTAEEQFGRPEAQPEGASLLVEECYRVGWFMRLLTKAPQGFEFC